MLIGCQCTDTPSAQDKFEPYTINGEITRVDHSTSFWDGARYYMTIDMGDHGITSIDRRRVIGLEGAQIECEINSITSERRLESNLSHFLIVGFLNNYCKRISRTHINNK